MEDSVWDVMGVREEVVIGDLGVVVGKEALDELGQFGVEAEAGKMLSEDVIVDKVQEARYVKHEGCGLKASGPGIMDVLS